MEPEPQIKVPITWRNQGRGEPRLFLEVREAGAQQVHMVHSNQGDIHGLASTEKAAMKRSAAHCSVVAASLPVSGQYVCVFECK